MLAANGGMPIGRVEALSVPAVQRGRNMLCSIATLPLHQVDGANIVHRSALLEDFDPDVPNVTHLAQTVEDMLFDGLAWWLVIARDFQGFPVSVRHLAPNRVTIQPANTMMPSPLPSGIDPHDGIVYVDGHPVSPGDVIGFHSPNPAVLKVGGRAIRRAILLDKAANMYADDPRPLDYFTPGMDADPAEDEEVKTILAQWKAARKERATAYVPASLKYNSVDSPSPAELQLVELQKQASLDIANALGIDPEDLGISTTSRTYSNDVDRRRNKLNEVLAPYMRVITDRLSKGDVTRRGYRVEFDTTQYLLPNPSERWSTYQVALDMGAITVDEIREKEGMPPLPASPETPALPAPIEARHTVSRTFDNPSSMHFDAPLTTATFSVDTEGRVIEGVVLPYDRVGFNDGLQFRFDRGSLQWDEKNPGRVKLLRDHDHKQAIGRAIQLQDTPDGMLARFKIGRTKEGDDALALAEDGIVDGLSVGVDFDLKADTTTDPQDRNVLLVKRATWRETSLTAVPAFDDARVTVVAASRTNGGGPVPDAAVNEPVSPAPDPSPEPVPVAATFTQEGPTPVNPARTINLHNIREGVPYRFDQAGHFVRSEHEFSTDIVTMLRSHDFDGTGTEAGRRVMDALRWKFNATVITTDVDELNPTIQRPDLFTGIQQFKTPIWNMINKGGLPNGVTPFIFPKVTTTNSSIVVSGHTEGTEPPRGGLITTSQTVTPTALSGKSSITREVWDQGGNPAISNLLMSEFLRSWNEGLESASATFLNTLTAATDINLGAGTAHTTLANNWNAALAGLQFVRSYNFSSFALEQWLYTAFAQANDETGGTGKGAPLFPMINPMNRDGTALDMFRSLNLGGVVGVPCWSLTAVSGSANNSWLFDAEYVHGWASGPQRLEFPGTNSTGGYAPVAMIDVGVFGYSAFACRDTGAVRQVIYDNT